jgi:NAD kinase
VNTLTIDRSKLLNHNDIDKLRGQAADAIVVIGEFPETTRTQYELESYLQDVVAPMVIDARDRCSRCTGEVMSDETQSETQEQTEKRKRAKDESPMARAKVAATKLRDLDATKGKLLLAIDRYQAKIAEQDEERAQFVLTLGDDVIAILKAGGVL